MYGITFFGNFSYIDLSGIAEGYAYEYKICWKCTDWCYMIYLLVVIDLEQALMTAKILSLSLLVCVCYICVDCLRFCA